MKKQFHIPIALAVFFLTFFCNAIAQNVDFRKESDLEKDIDNLISMKSNFSKIETTELNNYGNIEEFGTSIKPHNYSYNLSILKNKKSKTSAFVYANVETIEASYFAISINAFLINPNTKWKSEYDKGSPKFYSNATILYDHKESGYMVNYDRENKEHKTWLFIGNLAKDDIEKYLAEKYKISAIDNFLKEMNDFFPDSTISYLKNVFKDSTEKRENEKKSAI